MLTEADKAAGWAETPLYAANASTPTDLKADNAALVQMLRVALVQAVVPLEGLKASRAWVDLLPGTWAEIENGIQCVRAALQATEPRP